VYDLHERAPFGAPAEAREVRDQREATPHGQLQPPEAGLQPVAGVGQHAFHTGSRLQPIAVGAVAARLGRAWVVTDLSAAYMQIASERTAQRGLPLAL